MLNFRFSYAIILQLLPKFNDFISSDECIGNITSNSIRSYLVFYSIKDNLIKKGIISSENLRNACNYLYMIKLTRSTEIIFN